MGIYRKGEDFYIDYYVHGKRKREKIGTSRTLAQNVLRKRKVEIAENKYLDIRKEQKVKLEDLGNLFLELHSKVNKKPSAYERDKNLIKKLCLSFGGRYLYSITPMMIEEYKTKRAEEGKKPATINRELACLKCMFNKAIEWGKAHDNPVRKVKLFKENNTRVRFLEKEEIDKLLANCSDHRSGNLPNYLKPAVVISLNTGLRRGELLNLKWKDIDVMRGLIYLYNTKNGERREAIMNDIVKKAFISIPKNPKSPYIFCDENGEPFYNLRKSFFTALEKSGIKDFHWHDLRHTFASHLVMSGVDLMTVKELMGHKSIEMTIRYSHLSQSHKQHAVDILGKRMDTIWTPRPKTEEPSKRSISQPIDNKGVKSRAPVAQMDRAQVS